MRPACRTARRHHQRVTSAARAGHPAPAAIPESKPCAVCGTLVPASPGRRPDLAWYCPGWCQAEGRRLCNVAWRRRHGRPERLRGTCEHCHRSYYPTSRPARWALCSRPDCVRERHRRTYAAARARQARPVDTRPAPHVHGRSANADYQAQRNRQAAYGRPSTSLIDSGPTWRLIHGMIARGYTRTWIAGQLGATTPALQLGRTRVTRRQADAVRRVAEQCAITPGPSARARVEGERHGWRVDWLWEDLARGGAA